MSTKDVEKFLSVITDMGVIEIDMLGGEPTLYSNFFEIIELIKKKELKTTISSNGSIPHTLKKLSKAHNGNQIRVGVSVNSDAITQELNEYILEYKPMVKSICIRKRPFPEAVRAYLGRSDIECYLLYMDTIYEKDFRRSLPFYEFYQKTNTLKASYKNVNGVFCSGFVPDTQICPVLEHVRCPAGTTKLAVLPDGSVYPCYLFFRKEEFKLGNILFDDFKKMWKNPILDFFRRFEKNICTSSDCTVWRQCHGGCPAVSFLMYGDLTAADPRCMQHRATQMKRPRGG